VGVALSIFNTTTKLFNMPLLSVTTSSVARAQGAAQRGDTAPLSAAASSSIIIAGGLGMAQVSVARPGAGAGAGAGAHCPWAALLQQRRWCWCCVALQRSPIMASLLTPWPAAAPTPHRPPCCWPARPG
jgi:hypothetical protein